MIRFSRFIPAILIFVVFGGVSMSQQTVEEVISDAHVAYDSGNYELAASLYEDLVNNGFANFEIYYNLGSAYYEQGRLGDALLNYRRAQMIRPRHSQLNTNIIRIRSERVDFQGDEVVLIDRLATLSERSFSLMEISWAVFLLWSLLFFTGTVWVLRPSWRSRLVWPCIVLGIVVGIGFSLLLPRLYTSEYRSSAIITDLAATVWSGPGEHYLEIDQIFAGAEVRVVEVQDGWARFVRPSGRQGWILQDSIEMI